MWLRIGGFAVAALGILGVGVWVLVATGAEVAGYVVSLAALLVPVASLLFGRETSRRLAKDWPTVRDEKLRRLAKFLRTQWAEEERVRREPLHWPMPVRFAVPEDPESIMASWATIRDDPRGAALELSGVYDKFAEIFTKPDSPRRFVVLGSPGAGKSLLALKLGLDLLKQDDSSDESVPVLLPIGSWRPSEGHTLDDWVVERLEEDYPFLKARIRIDDDVRTIARGLVDEQRIIPILDGLDEMEKANRSTAKDVLSRAAAQKKFFVVTCRTDIYRELIDQSRDSEPLARTPVIELIPLTAPDIADCLTESAKALRQDPGKWAAVIRTVSDESKRGPLADALSTPFAVWLACVVYRGKTANPDELVSLPTVGHVMDRLLDGLIPATYGVEISPYPRRDLARIKLYESVLVLLAGLKTKANEPLNDLAWWELRRAERITLPLRIAAGIVTAVPSAIAFAAANHFESGPKAVIGAVLFGLVLGMVSAGAAGLQDKPRIVNIHWSLRQAAVAVTAGLAAGVGIGLVYAATAGMTENLLRGGILGLVLGIAGFFILLGPNLASALALGVADCVIFGVAGYMYTPHSTRDSTIGLAMGLAAGLATFVSAGIYQLVEEGRAISPAGLLHNARMSVLTITPACGITVGVAFAFARGPAAGVAAGIATALGILFSATPWGVFVLVCLVLAYRVKAPLRFVPFLKEAHTRGILRQVGGVYQFRHSKLAEHLTRTAPEGGG